MTESIRLKFLALQDPFAITISARLPFFHASARRSNGKEGISHAEMVIRRVDRADTRHTPGFRSQIKEVAPYQVRTDTGP